MKRDNNRIFIALFKDCIKKCFGHPVNVPLSEPESKLLSNKIFENTGLVIGTKSIKNYSRYVFEDKQPDSDGANPSLATLDTFARYILNAPYTNEPQRQDTENHYPYWYEYKKSYFNPSKIRTFKPGYISALFIGLFVLAGAGLIFIMKTANFFDDRTDSFVDNFNSVAEDSLSLKNWIIKDRESVYWMKRDEKPGYLTLYTLTGDNWILEEKLPEIKNLLMHVINYDCFVTELYISDFIPLQNWQQAGLILSEDTTFNSKMIRLSIGYNDFFGGYTKPAEIIIQVLSSVESGLYVKPEEIIHLPVFTLENEQKKLAENNLKRIGLKIEKSANNLKFLYSVSQTENFLFNKAAELNLTFEPRYVSIFAIQGWAPDEGKIPVYFDSFSIRRIKCR